MSAPTSPTQAHAARGAVDASALTRRELQYLARELELCRGNAKSDVIIEHVVKFMATEEGAERVAALLDAMSGEYKARTPGAKASTPTQKTRGAPSQEATPSAVEVEDDATPSRSTRRSTRNKPSDTIDDIIRSTDSASASSLSVKRKMDFESEDPAGESVENNESTTPKKERTEEVTTVETEASTTCSGNDVATKSESSTVVENTESPAKMAPMPTREETEPEMETAPATKDETTPVKKEIVAAKKEATPAKTEKTSEGPAGESESKKTPPRRSPGVKNGRSPLANVSNVPVDRDSKRMMAPSVESLLESYDDLVAVGSDRVKCTTTGHEMKADYDVISAYVSGKRYQRARSQKVSYAKFAPMFVDHPDEKQPHLVWCNVTQTAIARNGERIEAHMKGARYQKELPAWQAEQAALAAAAKEAEQKEVGQKEQESQKQSRPHAGGADIAGHRKKRKASGAIVNEGQQRVKVARHTKSV